MRTLLVACGNPLRRDDGVAAEVLLLVAPAPDREVRVVRQLTPELADEIARFDRVVFLDAAVDTDADEEGAASTHPTIELLGATMPRSPLTHVSTPAEIVALSRALFGFRGEALLCRIPVRDFSPAGNLSPHAQQFAREAADGIEALG